MGSHLIEARDLSFLLFEWLEVEALTRHAQFAAHDRTTFEHALGTARAVAEDHFLPHAAKADANEPRFDGTRVHLVPEIGAALAHYIDCGFLAASVPEDAGGMGLPHVVEAACGALFASANAPTAGYVLLTQAAANLLMAYGTPEQRECLARPLLAGRYFGTMCLSEPQAGSSLADVRTRAIPQPDGTFHLVGSKMWISGGDHELTENIVHLVLARIDGAPAGVKGLSLFAVPKVRVGRDGRLGARNGVRVAGLNHKMGYRGTVNCALSFGDDEPAVGEIVGQPNEGLACMFHMMNEARIGVGLGAAAIGYAGYRYALDYAKTRTQGRHPLNRDPASPPVPIIEHADVRRMLLAQKAWVEGGLALGLYCAQLVDQRRVAASDPRRQEIELLLDVLTPIAKAWPSQWCLEANALAIQVLGGYGYTRDYPVERLFRDNRLNPIHEGTNGVQAIDLLGRKVTMKSGAALQALLRVIGSIAAAAGEADPLAGYARDLRGAADLVDDTTRVLLGAAQRGQVDLYLSNAAHYLQMLGHVVVAAMWLDQARVATAALTSAADADRDFYTGKLHACRYFFRYELPTIRRDADVLQSLDDTTVTMPAGAF